MLVLTRRRGERVHVGDGIIITVVGTQGGRVRLGIEAPANVRVDRLEVHDRLAAQSAASGSDTWPQQTR